MIFFVANENINYVWVKSWQAETRYDAPPPHEVAPTDIVFGPKTVHSFVGYSFSDIPQVVRNAISSGYLMCYRAEAYDQYASPPSWDAGVLMPTLDQLFKTGVLHALMTYNSDAADGEASAHQCIYCQKGLTEHANSQCLFGSTKYFSWAAAFRLIKTNPDLLRAP